MILLDTNVVIAAIKGNPPPVAERLERELLLGPVALPVVVLFELRYGIAKSVRRKENTERLALFLQLPIATVPFDSDDAEEAGEIRAELERLGRPIGPYDLLIAGQARRHAATLATANTSEFATIAGLKTEDWAVI